MRRRDQEITDREEIDTIIRDARVFHLAMAESGGPYVLPLNFGYDGACIYFHSATEGRSCQGSSGRLGFSTVSAAPAQGTLSEQGGSRSLCQGWEPFFVVGTHSLSG